MKKANKILVIVLLIQVILAAVIWLASGDNTPQNKKKPFFAFEAKDVTSIEVTAMDGDKTTEPLKLKKDNGKWVLATADNYEAKKEAVDEMLDALAAVEIELPIAVTKANHATLNVAQDGFDRKLKIEANGKSVVAYLGRGSRNTTNIRMDGQKEVYEARELSVWKIHSKASNVVDTAYVSRDLDGLNKVTLTNEVGTVAMEKVNGKWTIPVLAGQLAAEKDAAAENPAATEDEKPKEFEVDSSAVEAFARKLSTVSMKAPVGKEVKDAYGLKNGATVILEGTVEDKPYKEAYNIGAAVDEDIYLKSEQSDYVVLVAKFAIQDTLSKKTDDFKKDKNAAPAAPPKMPGGMGGMGGMPGMGGMQMPPGMMAR